MSKASENRKTLYNFGKWFWHRGAYWGDKILTLIYLLLFGLLIISWRLTQWGYTQSIKGLKRFFGAIQTYRDGKRHKRDWQEYGRRPAYGSMIPMTEKDEKQ